MAESSDRWNAERNDRPLHDSTMQVFAAANSAVNVENMSALTVPGFPSLAAFSCAPLPSDSRFPCRLHGPRDGMGSQPPRRLITIRHALQGIVARPLRPWLCPESATGQPWSPIWLTGRRPRRRSAPPSKNAAQLAWSSPRFSVRPLP